MENRSRACGRKPSLKSKLRLLLTRTEAELLEDSAAQSGAGSRALLIAEALRAGLTKPNPTLTQERRSVRVDVWVPTELLVGLRRLAATYHLTQQNLLRLFLFRYLAAAPWELCWEEDAKKEEVLSE